MLSSPEPSFFDLAERKLEWLDERARVLAGNVANANTPGYRPRDLQPFSHQSWFELALAQTNMADMPGATLPLETTSASLGDIAPDGNAVSIEHQMKLVADTNADQQLTTTLYRKYLGFTMTALGAGSSS
jgi:flagellar basal-body rod protein FlgB